MTSLEVLLCLAYPSSYLIQERGFIPELFNLFFICQENQHNQKNQQMRNENSIEAKGILINICESDAFYIVNFNVLAVQNELIKSRYFQQFAHHSALSKPSM